MSRNFDLMQQLENDLVSISDAKKGHTMSRNFDLMQQLETNLVSDASPKEGHAIGRNFDILRQLEADRVLNSDPKGDLAIGRNFDLVRPLEADLVSNSDPIANTFAPVLGEKRRSDAGLEWASEEALMLVQRVFLLQTREAPRVVVFAGIDHGNGSSRICGAVGQVLARNSQQPVCMVEANFRSPGLPALFGAENNYGLTDALVREDPIRSFAEPVGDKLWLLSSGVLAADSPNLLGSERLKTRLAELRSEFGFVIIDAPPLTRYADAIALAQLSDGLVLVLEADATRKKAAIMAAANLRSSKIPILGAVLNNRTFPIPEHIYSRL